MAIDKTTIRNLTILVGSSTVVLATAGLAPALPGMALAFQDTPNAALLVRLALTIPALFGAVGAPLGGILSDRWGRKPVIVVALILYGLAGTAGYGLDSLTGILLTRAVLGLAMGGLINGFVTLLTDYYSGVRLNQFMGYQGAFVGFGGVVYQLLAGYLADIGWQLPFLLYLLAFVILPGVLLTVDEPQPRTAAKATTKVVTTNLAGDQAALPRQTIVLIYSIAFVGMVAFFTLLVHLPFYMTTHGGATNTQVGLALALQSLALGVVALQYYRLRARLSFQAIVALVFLTLSINLIVAALTPAYVLVVVGLLIGGLGVGVLPPNVIAWVAAIVPAAVRGRVVGGANSALLLGQFAAPLLTQPLVGQVGLSSTFGVVGGLSLLVAAVFIGVVWLQSGRLKTSVV